MASIPASDIVNINANVLSAGGSQLAMNGVFLTSSSLMTTNQLLSFASANDVAEFFTFASDEYLMAVKYFNGYSIAQSKPGQLYFYKVGDVATSAHLDSGLVDYTVGTMNGFLAEQLTLTVDGVTSTSSVIDLSTATTFAEAATLIHDAFSYGSPNFTVEYNSTSNRFIFTSLSTGTGSTITFEGGTAPSLGAELKILSSSTGSSITQGTAGTFLAADVPATMDALTDQTTNWATFATVFNPTLSVNEALADWVSAKNAEYSYILWDDLSSASNTAATGTIWNYVKDNALDNVFLIGKQPSLSLSLNLHAAFVSGAVASVDFNQTNNRPTFAFKSQAGLTIGVNNQTVSHHLIDNGYNFYGVWATRNDDFRFLYPGQVSGVFQWMDALVNAIYMKAKMQQTLMTLLTSVSSIPYNQQGYQGLIATSLIGDINDFINYGAIRIGVQPTAEQIAITQFQAGVDISQALFNKGYYLQVKDPGGAARQARTSPIINFWYMDGGAIQKINLTATLIQ